MAHLSEIYGVWDSAAAMAREIGVSEVTVRQWRNRAGRIPPRYWRLIQAAALLKGHDISLDKFVGPIAEPNSHLSAQA